MSFLEGVTVVDLSRVLAGPLCGMRLADWGARVIKVESPEGDSTRRFGPPFVDGESSYFMAYNRGKESIALDLKTQRGREITERLIESADVLIENFRSGVLERLGFGAARLGELRPDLVRVTISGYGTQTARSAEGAFDLAIQAETGLMNMTGSENGEVCRVPFSAADVAAGVTASESVLAALFARERDPDRRGTHLEIPLFDALMSFLGFQAQSTLLTGGNPRALGHRHPNLAPYQVFETADGAIVLAIATDEAWRRFLALEEVPAHLDRSEWARNGDRVSDAQSLVPAVAEVMGGHSSERWKRALDQADIPVGRLRNLDAALTELRERADGFLHDVEHAAVGPMEVLGSAVLRDGERAAGISAAPRHNEHARAIIEEFSRDDKERERWLDGLAGEELTP